MNMDLRAALSEMPFTASTAPAAGPADPWIDAAAVLAHFEPLTLNAAGGVLAPVSAGMSALLDASIPSRASRHARRLRPGLRRQALARLGDAAAMRAQLALNPAPDHPTQRAFAAILDGPEAVAGLMEADDPTELAALGEALDWVKGILPGLPDPAALADRLSRARLLMPLRRLVGEHFAGREDVLADIARHLNLAPDGAVLMLQGPGGVGKSTVLAKFILDAVERDRDPPTVILLNLDDPQMVIDDPFTLIQEAGRQLRIQHPEMGDFLDQLRGRLDSLQRRSRSLASMESLSGGTVEWTTVTEIARAIVALIPGRQPVLLVIDTFEEAQSTGPSAVSRLLQLVESLKSGNPRLSVIIAGRVDEPSARGRTLVLGALDPLAARAVLEKVAGLGPLPDALAEQVYAVAQGNPLATHLAGRILAAEGADVFRRDKDLARLIGQIRTEKVQAQLYGRVLGHIRDEDVRRLAYPGLVLRRITPGVLRHVLAQPCGVAIPDAAEAERLFDLFRHEVALAEPEPDGTALRYREDVRRVILVDLRADQPELARRIDLAAIAYYRDRPGAAARAEEIYHLLASGAGDAEIDARWEAGIEAGLARSVDELPPRAQVYLANRLRLDLRPELQQAADQQSWETNAEQTARFLLRDDLPEEALAVLNQRQARLPGSALYLTEAEALTLLGQGQTALEPLRKGLASAEAAGERLLLVNLRLLEGLILDGLGDAEGAGAAVLEAYRMAGLTRNDMARLRAIAGLLRRHRIGAPAPGPDPQALVAEAEAIIEAIGFPALFDQPGLMRELAAELGMRNPQFLAVTLRVTGAYVDLPEDLRDGGHDAAAAVSDPRAREIFGGTRLPEGGMVDALFLISSTHDARERYAWIALVTDLLAAELDGRRGALPDLAIRQQPKPWRESPALPEGETRWAEMASMAF